MTPHEKDDLERLCAYVYADLTAWSEDRRGFDVCVCGRAVHVFVEKRFMFEVRCRVEDVAMPLIDRVKVREMCCNHWYDKEEYPWAYSYEEDLKQVGKKISNKDEYEDAKDYVGKKVFFKRRFLCF